MTCTVRLRVFTKMALFKIAISWWWFQNLSCNRRGYNYQIRNVLWIYAWPVTLSLFAAEQKVQAWIFQYFLICVMSFELCSQTRLGTWCPTNNPGAGLCRPRSFISGSNARCDEVSLAAMMCNCTSSFRLYATYTQWLCGISIMEGAFFECLLVAHRLEVDTDLFWLETSPFSQQMFEEEEEKDKVHDLAITVSEPHKKGEGMNSYMTYRVRTKVLFYVFRNSSFLSQVFWIQTSKNSASPTILPYRINWRMWIAYYRSCQDRILSVVVSDRLLISD